MKEREALEKIAIKSYSLWMDWIANGVNNSCDKNTQGLLQDLGIITRSLFDLSGLKDSSLNYYTEPSGLATQALCPQLPQQKTFTGEEIDQLTQKLEKAREYLNAIVNGTHFTEDLSGHLIELAQQALKELE